MEWLKITDGIITDHCCGPKPDDAIEVTDFIGVVGDPVNHYDESWKKKKLSVLVSEKIVDIPEGKKINDDGTDFIEMTDDEKIAAGIIKPTEYQKIVAGKIVQKSEKELYDDGVITAEKYNEIIAMRRRDAYFVESDPIFYDYQEGKATKADWLASKDAIRERLPKVKE